MESLLLVILVRILIFFLILVGILLIILLVILVLDPPAFFPHLVGAGAEHGKFIVGGKKGAAAQNGQQLLETL